MTLNALRYCAPAEYAYDKLGMLPDVFIDSRKLTCPSTKLEKLVR